MPGSSVIALCGREARENLRLALPLIAAQVSLVAMGTVDTILAGRLSGDALAAVAVGANVWFLPFVFFLGVCMAVSPIVAQRVGARQAGARIASFVRGAMAAAVVLGLAWTAVLEMVADPVLDRLSLTPAVRPLAEGYLRVLAWGGVPFCLCFVLRSAAEGHGVTHVALWAGLAGLAYNTVAAYALMYGRLGMPALGAPGAGWATMSAGWVMAAAYLIAYRFVPRLRPLAPWRVDWRASRELVEVVHVGGPVALILTAEAWLFIIGALLMARFGGEVVAAHQIAINFASLTFMVPLSIGLATTVRVGHAAGARDRDAVRLRGRTGMLLGGGFAVVSASVMGLAPEVVVGVYTDAPDVGPLAVRFLRLAAVFQVFDCVQATANGALRGVKDTRMPMLITVAAYWLVGAPLAVWLAFATRVGPAGIWIGFIAGLGVAALGLSWRFAHRSAPARASVRAWA